MSGLATAARETTEATFQPGIGWISASGTCTSSPTVIESVIWSVNSANCVARTIVYGRPDALITFSWETLARMYPLSGRPSTPTIDNAT